MIATDPRCIDPGTDAERIRKSRLDDIKISAPVFAGDTPLSESFVLEKRESSSRPHASIVTERTRTLNQVGTEVCVFKRTFYVYKRGAKQVASIFPEGAHH